MSDAGVRALGRAAAFARHLGLRGAARAVGRVIDALLIRLGRAPLRVVIEGVPVRGYLRHRSFLAEAARPGETYAALFVRTLKPGATVIDGGAHAGLYTLLAARGVTPTGRVVAFEPDQYNLAALRLNVARSNATNVRVVPKALAEMAGTTTFYETASTIGSSVLPRGDARPVTIGTTSIDEELGGAEISSLVVKLNVEGAEVQALAGARETFARVASVAIFLEVNPPLLAAAGVDSAELVAGLRRDGFDVAYIDLATQALVPVSQPMRKGHLLATRESSR